MSESTVKVRIPYQFAPVPRHLAQDPKISPFALAVITYLCSRGEDWEPQVTDIRNRFKFSERAWRKVSSELRELKILGVEKTRYGSSLIFNPCGIDVESYPQATRSQCTGGATRSQCTGAQRTDSYREEDTLENYDVLKDHSYENDFEKNKKEQPYGNIKQRFQRLNSESQHVFEVLTKYEGMYPGVAMWIAEYKQPYEVYDILEEAKNSGIKYPGKYVVSSLYRK